MRPNSLLTVLPILACLSVVAGCGSAEFVYLELVSDNVSIVEVEGRPSLKPYFGDLVPSKYRYNATEFELVFSLGPGAFIPDLSIESSLPIIAIQSKDCAFVHSRSQHQSTVKWGYWPDQKNACVVMGEMVNVEVILEGVSEPIVVLGKVKKSGIFIYSD